MTLVFTLMLEMFLSLTGAGAQSVTQPDDHITVSEGARLELKCNYSSSVSPYLFWYVQYPDQGLQLLLKYMSGGNLVSGVRGFEAEFRKSEKSFHLRKIPAHWKDSAKYFCALSDTVPGHNRLMNLRGEVVSPLDLSRTLPAAGGLLVPYCLSGSPAIKQVMQIVTMVPGQGGRFQSVCFP
ncbi:hypothetical protein FD755_013104 [Muntiacus reevesi]|uniref:Ig-like domain-containing protein n=1 Tax=Muntiacus reevesi TaxID=9886 RepID=A0A5N3XMY4_MUNRE|nr:hypothetical protein FD755_013104 [Muntiacus reevesi]